MKSLKRILKKMNESIGKMSAKELIERIEKDKKEDIDVEIIQNKNTFDIINSCCKIEYQSAVNLFYNEFNDYNDYYAEEDEIWTSIKAS